MHYRILELYSGIGGMHCAWNESGINGEIIAAVEINTVANEVYKHNFPQTNLINRNIQSLTSQEIAKLRINTILMSPPCQPFTRNGNYLDACDPRTNSFIHIIEILPELNCIEYILMENVKGFECSTVHKLFIDKLKECRFKYQEFLLCPSTVGIPNSRLRYFCIARRSNTEWRFKTKEEIIQNLPNDYGEPFLLRDIIEDDVSETFLVREKILKRANVLDICYEDSKRSCCFTKAYSHYAEGTGSVLSYATPGATVECFKRANTFETGCYEFIEIIKELKLRFFTPKEVLALMAFPKCYSFPENISVKQCYRLLGNSVNVKIITELLKILCE